MQDTTFLDVTVENNEGNTVTVRFQDDERGNELADYLVGMARREELAEATIDRSGSTPANRPMPPARREQPRRTRGAHVPDPAGETEPDDAEDAGQGDTGEGDDAELEALRAEYERVFETAPDGRWQAARLRKELAKHQEG